MEGIGLQSDDKLGQLWCVPIETDLAAVWYETQADAEISALSVDHGPIEIVRQHRLLRPATILCLTLVRGGGLRDGSYCVLNLSSVTGSITALIRLAPARSANGARVLRFIVGKLRSSHQLGAWSPFARYLAFMANWRLRCDVVATLAGVAFAVAEVPAHHFGRTLQAFIHRKSGVVSRRISAIPLSDETIAVAIPQPLPERAFVELGQQLVECDFRFGAVADEGRAIDWLRGLPNAVKMRALALICDGPTRIADPSGFSAAVFPGEQKIELSNSSHLHVHIASVVEGSLLVCMEVSGNAEILAIQLGFDDAVLNPAIWSQSRRYLSPVKAGNASRRQRFVASAVTGSRFGGIAKIVIVTNFGRHEAFVTCRLGGYALRIFRSFLPEPTIDDSYLTKVLLPVAAAARSQSSEPSSITFGKEPNRKGGIGLTVIAGGDLDALHRTLQSVGAAMPVARLLLRVCLTAPECAAAVCQAMQEWAQQYELNGAVEIPLDDLGEATCTGQWNSHDSDNLIAVRAGTVLSAQWRRAIVRMGSSFDALILTAEDVEPKRLLDPDRILALAPEAILGMALPAASLRSVDDTPRFQSVEGEWLGLSLQLAQAGARVCVERDTSVKHVRDVRTRSRIASRMDRILLERLYAAHRAAVVASLTSTRLPRAVIARGAGVGKLATVHAPNNTTRSADKIRAVARQVGN